jgi:isoprenylcysteine carboxyl methyltransferase (ICMT) family protein YpbQ
MLLEYVTVIGILALLLTLRVAEFRVHRSNVAFLDFAGAEELVFNQSLFSPLKLFRKPSNLMRFYYLFCGAWAICAVVEFMLSGSQISIFRGCIGLILIAFGIVLKFWAIISLHSLWCMNFLIVRQFPIMREGPYRFMKHPEYLSRLMEGLGVSLLFGSWYSLWVCSIISVILLLPIVKFEKKLLQGSLY